MLRALGCGLRSMAALVLCTCAVDKFPLPDEFDAAFVTGNVCMPSNIKTGTTEAAGAPTYPLRIETCIYRCVEIDGPITVHHHWSCLGSQCQMTVLATAHVKQVAGQDDCDARDLPDPPASECVPKTISVLVEPPCCIDRGNGSEYISGDMLVSVPYLDLDQGDEVVSRIQGGESPSVVVPQVVGMQNYPERQFVVRFDPSAAQVSTDAELGADSCHRIAAP